MRLYPPCPFLARYCSEDTTIGENISVEEGTVVMWFNTYFHTHPDLYNNPKGTSLPFESILRGDPMNIVHVTWSMVYGKSKMLSRCILSTSRFMEFQIREL